MSHEETEWRPKGATHEYNGFEVWDHGIAPHEVNTGEVDGDISFDEGDLEEQVD